MTRDTVLLVEDEAVIALDMSLTLEDSGYDVMGPFKNVARTLERIAQSMPTIAVLDINLGHGETSFEIARRLRDSNVPVIFLTGYTESTVQFPDDLGDLIRLMKPVQDVQLLQTVADLLSA